MGIRKEYVKDGRKIIEYDDGAKATKCLTESCIQDHVSKESDTMSHDCDCESCSTKRLSKTDHKETISPEEFEELQQELPKDLLNDLMEFIEVEDNGVGDVPEAAEEVGKALCKSLYDDSRPERSGGLPASNHLGNVVDEKSASGGTPGSAEVYARSLVEKETVDLGDDADTPDSLNRFYESQGESL